MPADRTSMEVFRKSLLVEAGKDRPLPRCRHYDRYCLDRNTAAQLLACFGPLSILHNSDVEFVFHEWQDFLKRHPDQSPSLNDFAELLVSAQQVAHEQERGPLPPNDEQTQNERLDILRRTLFVAGFLQQM